MRERPVVTHYRPETLSGRAEDEDVDAATSVAIQYHTLVWTRRAEIQTKGHRVQLTDLTVRLKRG